TEAEIAANERFLASQGKVATAYTEAASIVTQTLIPTMTRFNEVLATALVRDANQFATDWANIAHAWQSFWTVMENIATTATANIKAAWASIANLGSGIGSAVSSAASALKSGADTGAPYARGGYVRGPGTGTSDSVLARLSAGEFVINSASVRRLGTSFLSGLNGFAGGGLVGIPRFAAGGLVAGGGRPVHLHLGGQSFALSGNGNVVSALVAEAARQQTRSAGVKPSWFGGRAGGH